MSTPSQSDSTRGHPSLVTPYTTTEFHKMADKARAHHHAMHDQLVVMAAELYRGLCKIRGRRGLMGVDVRLAARKVVRNLLHAAALEDEAAKAITRSYTQYTALFLNRPQETSRGFDPDK